MAYETYTTKAIVCGSYERGEHDRVLRILTEGAGMVFASARGLRKGESKLRYALQDFSYSTVSLIHGKREWRVTGAENLKNFYFEAKTRDARVLLLAYLRTVRRLIHGSEDSFLFRLVIDGMHMLAETGAVHALPISELRLLNALGYVRGHDGITPLLSAATLEDACSVPLTESDQAHIGHIIKESMKMSHL